MGRKSTRPFALPDFSTSLERGPFKGCCKFSLKGFLLRVATRGSFKGVILRVALGAPLKGTPWGIYDRALQYSGGGAFKKGYLVRL